MYATNMLQRRLTWRTRPSKSYTKSWQLIHYNYHFMIYENVQTGEDLVSQAFLLSN